MSPRNVDDNARLARDGGRMHNDFSTTGTFVRDRQRQLLDDACRSRHEQQYLAVHPPPLRVRAGWLLVRAGTRLARAGPVPSG